MELNGSGIQKSYLTQGISFPIFCPHTISASASQLNSSFELPRYLLQIQPPRIFVQDFGPRNVLPNKLPKRVVPISSLSVHFHFNPQDRATVPRINSWKSQLNTNSAQPFQSTSPNLQLPFPNTPRYANMPAPLNNPEYCLETDSEFTVAAVEKTLQQSNTPSSQGTQALGEADRIHAPTEIPRLFTLLPKLPAELRLKIC
jgi:hypothetical protein